MTNRHRDYFLDRKTPDHVSRNLSRNEEVFEAAKVVLLLNRFKMPATVRRELADVHRAATGRRLLRLSVFCDRFASFPLFMGASLLGGCKLHVEPRATIPAWFNTFKATPFYLAYENFYEQVVDRAGNRAVGLIFNRKGFPKGMIIHNGSLIDFYRSDSDAHVHMGGRPGSPRYICVQPFASVLDAIYNDGRGWRPE